MISGRFGNVCRGCTYAIGLKQSETTGLHDDHLLRGQNTDHFETFDLKLFKSHVDSTKLSVKPVSVGGVRQGALAESGYTTSRQKRWKYVPLFRAHVSDSLVTGVRWACPHGSSLVLLSGSFHEVLGQVGTS